MDISLIGRLSRFASIARHECTLAIDRSVIKARCDQAGANPRKREILVLHSGDSDPLQRMLNAIQPGSYIRPHRHLSPLKPEPLVLLAGAAAFVVFEEDGSLDIRNSVLLHPTKGALALDHRGGHWHTFFALERDTVLFEVKPGPFDPTAEKEFAPWAPEESGPGAARYLASLEQAFRSAYGLPN